MKISTSFIRLSQLLLTVALCSVASLSAAAPTAKEAHPCGALSSSLGAALDYRKQHPILADVEYNHFTPGVEALARGRTGLPAGMELRYVLAVFPNHHRALAALVQLGLKERTTQPKHLTYSIDCHFDRALRVAHDDNVVRLLYSQYLAGQGRIQEAVRLAVSAQDLAGDNGFSHYNIGLVFFELGEHELALKQAWRAAELNFSRPQLRQLLEKAGKWRDPPPP